MGGCFHLIGRAISSIDHGPRVEVSTSRNGDVSVSVSGDYHDSVSIGDSGPTVEASGPMQTENRQVGSFHGVSAGSIVELTFRQGPEPKVEVSAQADVLPHVATKVEDGILRVELESGTFHHVDAVRVTVTNPRLDFIGISGSAKGTVSGIDEEALHIDVSGAGGLTIDGNAKGVATDVSGSGKLVARLQSPGTLQGDVSGDASAELKGTFGNTDLMVSGSGNIELSEVKADTVELRMSGSATAKVAGSAASVHVTGEGAVHADLNGLQSQTCNVEASGASQLYVDATKTLTAGASGAASVTYRGNPQVQSDVSGAGQVSAAP